MLRQLEQSIYADPGTHTQTIGKFPLTTHVSIDADEEVEDYELERTTVICHSSRDALPRWDRSGVQLLEEGTTAPEMMLLPYMSEPSDGFTDAIDVHRRNKRRMLRRNRWLLPTELESSERRTNRHRGGYW